MATALPIEITVEPAEPTGTTSLPLEVEVVEPSVASLPLTVSVYNPADYPGHNGTANGGTFAVRVEVGGEDYTDRLMGQINIDAEEDAARVATFEVLAPDGEFQPDAWINLPVVIDYIQGGVSFQVFTGIVDLPDLSLDDQSIRVSATDNRQGRFEAKDRSVIEGLFANTGAKWHPSVFGSYSGSADFADDLLSTIPASADLDSNGNLVFGQWYAAGYDFLFSDDEVFPDSIGVEWASRRDLINSVRIELEYTYQFFRERRQRFTWEYPRTFESYLEQNTTLPNVEMIGSAADVGGWELVAPIQYTRLPPSGTYTLPGGAESNWVISDELREYLAIGADFTLRTRWVQDVRETHSITINSTANQARFGVLEQEIRLAVDTSVDIEGFEDFTANPPGASFAVGSDTAWQSASLSEFSAVVDTVVAQAEVVVQASHRLNSLSFRTLMQPLIERYHFVKLESAKVVGQGKVRRVQHLIDLDAGSAITNLELAVFRGEATTGTALNLDGIDYSEPSRDTVTELDSAIQLMDSSLPIPPDDFAGYVGNELQPFGTLVPEVPFEERFSILTPEITEAARNPVEQDFAAVRECPMYNQTLTVTL